MVVVVVVVVMLLLLFLLMLVLSLFVTSMTTSIALKSIMTVNSMKISKRTMTSANNHKTLSRLLVCWWFVNQQLVIILAGCNKNNHYDHCCYDC